MASNHLKTQVDSHPLSSAETPSPARSRRSRRANVTDTRPTTNYLTLKAKLEQDTLDVPSSDSVRGYSNVDKGKSVQATLSQKGSSTSLAVVLDRPARVAPFFVVGSPQDSFPHPIPRTNPEFLITSEFDPSEFDPAVIGQVMATKWHEYSDEAIQSTISSISITDSPADISSHPYHTALRILSSALHNLSRVRSELEESRKLLLEKEIARRSRADDLIRELQSSEQDVARRVIQSIFTDDDENQHRIQRKHSVMVRFFRLKQRNLDLYLMLVTDGVPDRSSRARRIAFAEYASRTYFVAHGRRTQYTRSARELSRPPY